jgi:hypothetical protein
LLLCASQMIFKVASHQTIRPQSKIEETFLVLYTLTARSASQ